MIIFYQLTLAVHITAGGIALFVAPCAMVCTKGALWHRRWGKTFFWCMAVVSLTALVMCTLGAGLFLLLVAVFSFYLAGTGYRAIYIKQPVEQTTKLDWVVTLSMLIAAAGFILYGAMQIYSNQPMGWVAMVFGLIGGVLAGLDLKRYLIANKDPKAWWFEHMIRMLSAYIATVTAFSVVNFSFLPETVRWLWPTVIGTAGITVWVTYYRMRFARFRQPQNA